MKDESYNPPTVRNILLGILLFAVMLAFLGYLGDITKWTGELLYFLPSRFGLIERVRPHEVIILEFSENPSQVYFPAPGRYAFYTSNIDLLEMSNVLMASPGAIPWLVFTSNSTSRVVPVEFIHRGLSIYDTPFARGRPIFSFYIPEAGTYTLAHPTRDTYVYLTPDSFTGREQLLVVVALAEIIPLGLLIAWLSTGRSRRRMRDLRALRQQQRVQAEQMLARERKRRDKQDPDKPKDRWSSLE